MPQILLTGAGEQAGRGAKDPVLIVGAGIAGLATAAALHKVGMRILYRQSLQIVSMHFGSGREVQRPACDSQLSMHVFSEIPPVVLLSVPTKHGCYKIPCDETVAAT